MFTPRVVTLIAGVMVVGSIVVVVGGIVVRGEVVRHGYVQGVVTHQEGVMASGSVVLVERVAIVVQAPLIFLIMAPVSVAQQIPHPVHGAAVFLIDLY